MGSMLPFIAYMDPSWVRKMNIENGGEYDGPGYHFSSQK
jgi:hypothetical protein